MNLKINIKRAGEVLFSVSSADCRRDTFRSGGKGGQNQNKVESGVRYTHVASGAVGEARDTRTQGRNERAAFERMVNSPEFRSWLRLEVARVTGRPDLAWSRERRMSQKGEKIRTYHFGRGNVVDHRVPANIYDLEQTLDGHLDPIITDVLVATKGTQ